MKPIIIDGNLIASRIIESVSEKLRNFSDGKPVLASISVGKNPSVESYIRNQQVICQKAGITHSHIDFPSGTNRREILEMISRLNSDVAVSGIIINLPFDSQRLGLHDEKEIVRAVSPHKDVEGLHPSNMGALFNPSHARRHAIFPTAPMAVIECIRTVVSNLKGKEVVIVGHSEIVGKPLALMLLASEHSSPTVTVCHIATKALASHTRRADMLVTAVGRAGFITKDMVKEGAVVIDVGINRIEVVDDRGKKIINPATGQPRTRIVGDVNFDEVQEVAYAITPVPGGVGPVTSSILARNTMNLFFASRQYPAKRR